MPFERYKEKKKQSKLLIKYSCERLKVCYEKLFSKGETLLALVNEENRY